MNRRGQLVILLLLVVSFTLALSPVSSMLSQGPLPSEMGRIATIAQEPSVRPSPRYGHTMAYDSESDRIIIFGGFVDIQFTPSSLASDTWSYDLLADRFTEHFPAASPPATEGASMTYDSKSDKVVLYTGVYWLGDGPRETWVYDYNRNQWSRMTPSETPPFSRWGHSMAYDSESDRIILFGGREVRNNNFWGGEADFVTFSDTWAYDLDSNTWTEMSPQVQPPSRANHKMAYDEQSDRIILFGGETENQDELGGTWAYDYNSDNWEEIDTSISPPPRYHHSMTYDSESDSVVLVGGYGLERFNDTWSFDYDLRSWYKHSPIPNQMGVVRHNAIYHSRMDVVMVFGGFSGFLTNKVWNYATNVDVWFDEITEYDNDNDELSDLLEFEIGTQWFNPDTDLDLMPDGWEYLNGLNPLDPADAQFDPDNDGLQNLEEYNAGTDPQIADSDRDSYSDSWEMENGFDPTNPIVSPQQFMVYYSPLILLASITPLALIAFLQYRKIKALRLEEQNLKNEEEERRRAFADLVEHAKNGRTNETSL